MAKKYKIVVDSSSDLTKEFLNHPLIDLEVVPLSINIGEQEFIDDENIDVAKMLKAMNEYTGKSTSSCPSPGAYYESFGDNDKVFCVTISSELSGSYNSCMSAASKAKEKGKQVFVVNSLLVAGSEILIVEELVRLIEKNFDFQTISEKIIEFRDKQNLYFVLDKFDNLIKNGRMTKLQGIIASLLKIKPILKGEEGKIRMLEKKRTTTQALKTLVDKIGEVSKDNANKDLIITHVFNEEVAQKVAEDIKSKYNFRSIRVLPMRGLTAFYALEKGIIVCF